MTLPVTPERPPWRYRREVWTRRQVLDAFRRFEVLYGRPPKQYDFDPYSARRYGRELAPGFDEGVWPTVRQVARAFGSWSAALVASGAPARTPPRRWTRERVLGLIDTWVQEHGRAPTVREWTAAGGERPSWATVRELFGTWNAALRAAGYRPRHVRGPNRRVAVPA